jgi:hypothetical protein
MPDSLPKIVKRPKQRLDPLALMTFLRVFSTEARATGKPRFVSAPPCHGSSLPDSTSSWRRKLPLPFSEFVSVRRVWSQSYEQDKFLYLRDPRCIFCFETMSRYSGVECPNCHACNFCHACSLAGHMPKDFKTRECYTWFDDVRSGFLIEKEIVSFAVAMKIPIFEEGEHDDSDSEYLW